MPDAAPIIRSIFGRRTKGLLADDSSLHASTNVHPRNGARHNEPLDLRGPFEDRVGVSAPRNSPVHDFFLNWRDPIMESLAQFRSGSRRFRPCFMGLEHALFVGRDAYLNMHSEGLNL
jgi:hypothetical protein